MKKLISNFLIFIALFYSGTVLSLDKNGNFESRQEQDAYLRNHVNAGVDDPSVHNTKVRSIDNQLA